MKDNLFLGAWQITDHLTSGIDERDPDDDPKYLWFMEDRILTGDDWAVWEMPFVSRGDPNKGEIDITRDDLNEPWLQLGIYEISGDTLKLCMAGGAHNARPSAMESTKENEHVLYVAKRTTKEPPE